MEQDSRKTRATGYPPLEVLEKDTDSGLEVIRYTNGTCSLRDPDCNQTMHSRVGPEEESRIVYAESAQVSERLKRKSELTLWDVGMGTGANVVATLDEIIRNGSPDGAFLRVESFEAEPRGLALALKHLKRFPRLETRAKELALLLEKGEARFEVSTRTGALHVEWRLWTGDFYAQLEKAPPADLIYFDFYSPRAHPSLWTRQRFRAIRERLGSRDAELFTYSAATPVRLALLLGGFYVGYGARTVMKTETTIAATRLSLLRAPLDERWKAKLDLSTSIDEMSDRAAGHEHRQWTELGDPAIPSPVTSPRADRPHAIPGFRRPLK